MTKKIELNLNKSSIFRVAGFLADLNINETLKEAVEKTKKEKLTKNEVNIIGVQALMKLFAESEQQFDELFADLADVSVEEIQALDFDEFYDLAEDFIEAGLLQRAFKLFRGTQKAE